MKKSNIICLIIALISPILSEIIFKNSDNTNFIYNFLWAILNYLFLYAAFEITTNNFKILSLKNLQIKKSPYIITTIIYWCFLIYFNTYFLALIHLTDGELKIKLTSPFTLFILFIIFILNLLRGIHCEIKEQDTTIYNVSEKPPFRYGRETFGTLVGSYDDGLVLGNNIFNFSDMNSIYKSKNKKEIVIKGKNEKGNYRLGVSAPKSREVLEKILVELKSKGRLDNINLNF